MKRALGLACFACIGLPWIVWEIAAKRLKRSQPVEPKRVSQARRSARRPGVHLEPECPGCGEPISRGDFHVHEGHAFMPTSDPFSVLEVVPPQAKR